ncbi:N5-carboxyaminoimidazole ribonucleotide synthase [Hydrogenophilus thermoluteolus]|uniref:5-(carboxyamino)imidazole ribonucleotide synthase n=1 Tax=Hydrogenophilus thermoluteolus TaxID=297 RepID=UPI0024A4B7EA|nr:5-(carboxyamino)imidazole ribonucleotide synthase [Hydrogenophilus thermoluteolus]GLW60158.1 N5-carboxyaminoimidazole ribonucleotide synthase [Hydrogenophilus thermoluteolus]
MDAKGKPQPIVPPATLAVLGGGQLGRFFVRAAQELGFRVWVLDPDPNAPAGQIADRHLVAPYDDADALAEIARHCAAATTEFENVPAEALRALARSIPVRPGADAVEVCQDRRKEKRFLAANGLPYGPFWVIESADDCAAVPPSAYPAILKTARLGYDGKGQRTVESADGLLSAWDSLGRVPCVLEKRLTLAAELSVVLARGVDGMAVAFPPGENVHRNGILDTTTAPAPLPEATRAHALDVALRVAAALDYVGVLGVEFFYTDDGLLAVNEMAPRPHNSGHHTIDACSVSQFEQQVRALCALPLAPVRTHSLAVMNNLLGDLWFAADGTRREPEWGRLLALPGVALHLYGKHEPRPGRKMGHFTVTGSSWEAVRQTVCAAREQLGLPTNGWG